MARGFVFWRCSFVKAVLALDWILGGGGVADKLGEGVRDDFQALGVCLRGGLFPVKAFSVKAFPAEFLGGERRVLYVGLGLDALFPLDVTGC